MQPVKFPPISALTSAERQSMQKEALKKISEGEEAREKLDFLTALICFNTAYTLFEPLNNASGLLSVIGHRFLVYKRRNKSARPGSDEFKRDMQLMKNEVTFGAQIANQYREKITDSEFSVILLRFGDCMMLEHRYTSAANYYKKAFDSLGLDAKAFTRAEYMNHYAEAIAQQQGDGYTKAFRHWSVAMLMVLGYKEDDLRPFHRLIILSGIQLNQSKAHLAQGDEISSIANFLNAASFARTLRDVHHKPARLADAEEVRQCIVTWHTDRNLPVPEELVNCLK